MYEKEVARGAAWLDEHVGPHWPLLINPEELKMGECSSCVIGQTFGIQAELERQGMWVDFGGGVSFKLYRQAVRGIQDDAEYGFNLGEEHDDECFDIEEDCEHWQALRDPWIAEAKRRLDEGVKV